MGPGHQKRRAASGSMQEIAVVQVPSEVFADDAVQKCPFWFAALLAAGNSARAVW